MSKPADRAAAGQPEPTWAIDPISAPCSVHRHAQCRGLVVSLLFPQDQPCCCPCHALSLPATWKVAA